MSRSLRSSSTLGELSRKPRRRHRPDPGPRYRIKIFDIVNGVELSVWSATLRGIADQAAERIRWFLEDDIRNSES